MTKPVLIVAGCLAAALVAALPATANDKPASGTRIALGAPPATFAADSPFHIEHGFSCDLGDGSCNAQGLSAQSEFRLYLDGAIQPSTVDIDVDDDVVSRLQLTDYATGLAAGTHTFVGVWYLRGTVVQTTTATITFT
jgi:hypothetical protein